MTLLRWEYSSSRSFPKTQVLAAIPAGTIIGPVLEVHIVKILDGYGTEVAIPSNADPVNTSYVVISRETERFVNEVHDHKEELRSSGELLADLQSLDRSEPHGEGGTRSIKETCASQSIKETCASLHKRPSTQKRTIPTSERKCEVIHAHCPYGGDLANAVSKMATTMVRHQHKDERQPDGSMHWDKQASTVESVCTTGSTIFFRNLLVTPDSGRQQ